MKKAIMLTLMGVLAFGLMACGETQQKTPDNKNVNQELIYEAYTYCFPLVLVDTMAASSTNTEKPTDTKAPTNQLIHAQHLADSESKQVVTPNVDTIYTQAFLDLANDALVFDKPAADRFFSIEILDYYTNSTTILGTAGDGQEECTYLLTGPNWEGDVPEGLVHVKIPTNNAWIIARTVVSGEDDLANVYELQKKMHLVPLSAYLAQGFEYDAPEGVYDANKEYVPVEHVLTLTPQEFFARANELMVANPPAADDAEALERFAQIGVGPGLEFDATTLGNNVEADWKHMLTSLEERWTSASDNFVIKAHPWSYFGRPIAEFGTEYEYRALIALGGLGANPVSVAVYPRAEAASNHATLTGENAYVIHFEKNQLPPVEEYGFWSITSYGEDDFLIDNSLDRYAINDRSAYTFNDDGSLDLYIQADAPKDDALKNNWLPVHHDQFHLVLRIYLPAAEILAGDWSLPEITPLAEAV